MSGMTLGIGNPMIGDSLYRLPRLNSTGTERVTDYSRQTKFANIEINYMIIYKRVGRKKISDAFVIRKDSLMSL